MASQPAGSLHQQEFVANGPLRKGYEGSAGGKPSSRFNLAGDDADAADILLAWDRARAAEDGNINRSLHADSGIAIDGVIAVAGSIHDEEGVALDRRKLTSSRFQHVLAQSARTRTASNDGRKGVPKTGSELGAPDAVVNWVPQERVRRAKQRRNSYSAPLSNGFPLEFATPPIAASVSQQGAPLPSARPVRRLPTRRATLNNLDLGLPQPTTSASQLEPGWGPQQPVTTNSHAGGALSGSGRETPIMHSSGQHANLSVDGADGTGIRKKFIRMISIPGRKPRPPTSSSAKATSQGVISVEAIQDAPSTAAESDSAGEEPENNGLEAPRAAAHDSDTDDPEDVRNSAAPAVPWKLNGSAGPSATELRLMGATNSVSFRKSTKQGVLRPLSTLPPFVPRLFIEDITLNHDKYRGFDAAGRDLTAASKTLQPSIIELQAAVMIADVTGFTKLTEILSKKGTSGVELLTTCMNNYFTRAINMIMAFEGDVVKFAGDSMIVLFYPNEHERRHADKGLRACTLRMMSCSHQLATKLGHMRMKMNGQVEFASPPAPEPTPSNAAAALGSSLYGPTLSTALGPGATVPMPSSELMENVEGAQSDMLRNNSGPFSAGAGGPRRVGRDSPRSSATNQAAPEVTTGEDASSPATDGPFRAVDGSDGSQQALGRRRGKSWSLMANILKVNRAMQRRNEANATPGSMSPAAASSSGPSRASFEKGDPKATTRLSARERAKTETGLGISLRPLGGGSGSIAAADTGGGAAATAGLWAGDGVVRREMSVATKLNLPPPLRPMQPRASLTLSPLNAASGSAGTANGAPLAAGVYQGSGSALASLANGGLSPTSGSPRSFTEQAAASGGSFRRVPLAGRSERRMTGGPTALVSAGTGDWRSKLQNLSTAIVNTSGGVRTEEDGLAPQRSRLSETARAVRWDTVQEEEGVLEEDGVADNEREDEDDEDASYPPIQSDGTPSAASIGPSLAAARGSGSGPSTSGTDGSGHGAGLPSAERVFNATGSQSMTRSTHAVDLRRKLLLRASQSDRDDLQMRRGAAGSNREEGTAGGGGVGAPGPVGEGLDDVLHGRSRGGSETEIPPAGGDAKQGSFMSKVVNWFSANARNRNSGFVDSFSNLGPHQPATAAVGQETQSDAQVHSQPPSAPVSASNSYTAGGMGISIVRGGLAGLGSAGLGGSVPSVPPSKGPRGDPTMDEVSNSRLSLKVMTSAGSVCVFHVGGGVDEVTDPTLPEVPRWEFFIGDRPLAPLMDANQRRRCISQVAAIEDQATAGSVVASIEVVELIQSEWEVMPLPDSVWRVVGPTQPTMQPHIRLSHTSVRTSATSHTPHWRSSDIGVGSSNLPHLHEQQPATEPPQATGAEAMEDLAALQALRMTSSATNGQPGVASSIGQPSSVLGPLNRSLGNSLNGSSDRPTNGSGAERTRPQVYGHHPQSLLAAPVSARYESDTPVVNPDGIERADSVPAGGAQGSVTHPSPAHVAASALHPSVSVPGPMTITASATAATAGNSATSQLLMRLRHEFVNLPDHVQRRIAGWLRMHVLGSVRVRVEAGHLDFINEIRPLTCMFLGFPSLLQPRDDVCHKDQVQCVQFAYTSVQAVMRKWDGSFLQFRSDEKGFVGICAFGLPGHTHEDNPSRGIRAALELASTIRAGGHTVAIGVTTGDLLCTCVGARKLRSEYTVFGDAINLSARLMVKCKKDPSVGEILCDEPTYVRAKYQASFIELEPLPVKGKAQPVLVYRVGAHDATAEAAAQQQRREAAEVSSGERPLIGRDQEMTLTLNHAASMISGATQGGIIIIEGNTGMGKTKLLMEIRKSLERINADTSINGRPAFYMVFGMADTANKSQKLHPWRRVFQELFSLDLKMKNLGVLNATSLSSPGQAPPLGQVPANGSNSLNGQRRTGGNASASGQGGVCGRRRGTEDGPGHAVFTPLGERLCKVPNYDTEWRQHLAELLDLPLASIPLGSLEAEQAQFGTPGHHPLAQQTPAQLATTTPEQVDADGLETVLSGMVPVTAVTNGVPEKSNVYRLKEEARDVALASSLPNQAGSNLLRSPWRASSMRHASVTMAGTPPVMLDAHTHATSINVTSPGAAVTNDSPSPAHGPPHNSQVGKPIHKNSLNFLVVVLQEFISLYGPTLVLLENLHDFDTWSWQLLVKAAEVLISDCMILATTRPNDLPTVGASHHLHGKAALYQKVAMMYRHLLKLPCAHRIVLEPFTFVQTKSLMQVVSDIYYPDQYVLAVMEKTGGMPLYIEKVTEFLSQSQRPFMPDQGEGFSANVNKMIRNLNFQQVIIERMDRLKPGIHLTLKVASVMGQWVDLDILHKFYPINKSKEELRSHLQELERGNFLKPTDADGVWEFNMVERDIVYEVIPHYQRRRLHAKLAQELEKSLEEQHVATLTTIAYHWNQACMGHEVAEVECSLKAIEFWHRAAEAAYTGSSLMEALKLYQKAAQIAELLAESMGGSVTTGAHQNMFKTQHERHSNGLHSGPSITGREGNSLDGRIDAADQSFTAVGSAFKGQLNWGLISRVSRSQWEKSMASCCLGIVLQHRYEFNTQLEYWDAQDYFRLLTEHAIRGLMLLGSPHPNELLRERSTGGHAILGRLCVWCFESGAGSGGAAAGPQHGWHTGLVLQDNEVQEIRDILLVLIIAAENYSSQHDGTEYTRLLTFCKRVCKFFNKCSDSGTDPFVDIRSACSSRIKNYKASRALQTTYDFGVSQDPGLEAAAARNADLSRVVLGWHRQATLGRGVYG